MGLEINADQELSSMLTSNGVRLYSPMTGIDNIIEFSVLINIAQRVSFN